MLHDDIQKLPRLAVTRAEAAAMVGLSEDAIRRAVNTGSLKAKRTASGGSGKYLISVAALQAWFDGLDDA